MEVLRDLDLLQLALVILLHFLQPVLVPLLHLVQLLIKLGDLLR